MGGSRKVSPEQADGMDNDEPPVKMPSGEVSGRLPMRALSARAYPSALC